MSLNDNLDINNVIENKEFDKAVNLYLKVKDEDSSDRLTAISAAINLSNNHLSEKSHKKIIAAIKDALTLNPDEEWSTNVYNYMLKAVESLNFSEIDKAKNFIIISEFVEQKSVGLGKDGFLKAGNEYHKAFQFELAKESYDKAQQFDRSYSMFQEDIKYNFHEYNISKAINTLDKLIHWNEDHNYTSREIIFDFWYEETNAILQILVNTELFLNIKKKIKREEIITALHESIWEQALSVNKISLEIWEWYFQQALTMELVPLLDFWIDQALKSSLHNIQDLGSYVNSKIEKLNLENLIQFAPLFIRKFQTEKSVLNPFAGYLENAFSTSIPPEIQLNVINQIIFLFQYLEKTNKTLWWKLQRASVYYRLKNLEHVLKDLEEIGSLSKNNNEYINKLGDSFLNLTMKLTKSKDYELAEQSFNILVGMYQSINDVSKAGKILGDQSALFYEHKRKNASDIMNKAISILSGSEHINLRGRIHQKIGESLFNIDQESEALILFKQANKLYLDDKTNSVDNAKTLGSGLEVYSRQLLQDKKKRKLYEKYYSFTESVFQDWGLGEELSKTLVFELKRLIESNIDPEDIATMAEKTGSRLHADQEIDLFAKMLQTYTDQLIENKDMSNASNISAILLKALESLKKIDLVKKYGVALAMNYFKIEETIIAEDVLEKAIQAFDQDEEFQAIGDALLEAGIILARAGNHEQAVASIGRSVPFYEDANNSKKIEDTIAKCLEIAKKLGDRGKEEAQMYITKANTIMTQTGVKLSETITDTVYTSYSEHILSKTEELIKEKSSQRKYRKKRQFFKKKTEEF